MQETFLGRVGSELQSEYTVAPGQGDPVDPELCGRLIGNQVFQKSRGTGQHEEEVHSRGGGGADSPHIRATRCAVPFPPGAQPAGGPRG